MSAMLILTLWWHITSAAAAAASAGRAAYWSDNKDNVLPLLSVFKVGQKLEFFLSLNMMQSRPEIRQAEQAPPPGKFDSFKPKAWSLKARNVVRVLECAEVEGIPSTSTKRMYRNQEHQPNNFKRCNQALTNR